MIYFFGDYYQHNSFGIVSDFELILLLENNGFNARYLCCQPSCLFNKPIPERYSKIFISNEDLPKTLEQDDIIILPDVWQSNPFKSGHVIRWLLNKPMFLTGKPIKYEDEEIVVAYSKLVKRDLPQLFILRDERALFKSLRSTALHDEKTISVYFGKIHKKVIDDSYPQLKRILSKYKTIHLITRWVPAEREEALKHIADSSLLVSFDALTNMNYEATLLGTPVLMMDDTFDIEHSTFNLCNNGLAFKYSGVKKARIGIDSTFEDYCNWLNHQEQYLLNLFSSLMDKIKEMKDDPDALEKNKEINNSIYEEDVSEYKKSMNCVPFDAINYPEELPKKIGKLFGVEYKLMDKNRIKHSLAQILRKIGLYAIVKKIWTGIKLIWLRIKQAIVWSLRKIGVYPFIQKYWWKIKKKKP